MRGFRNSVICRCGLPKSAGTPATGATICAKNAPQLLPMSKSGCSASMMLRMRASASRGCNGKSGVSTSARPANASRNAPAIAQPPEAKNPCKNNIFFIIILLNTITKITINSDKNHPTTRLSLTAGLLNQNTFAINQYCRLFMMLFLLILCRVVGQKNLG